MVDASKRFLYQWDSRQHLEEVLMKISSHFSEMFPRKKRRIAVVVAVVAAAVAVVVEVLDDEFRQFPERQHRLNLNYRMLVLDHPFHQKKETSTFHHSKFSISINLHRQSIILLPYSRDLFVSRKEGHPVEQHCH